MKNNALYGVFILISTIVGLGIFTLPYAAFKSGLFFYFWLIIIPILVFFFHLIYGEIIFQVEEKHNLPSLLAKIINPQLKIPIWFIDFLGLIMVFIAYLIAIDEILKKIFLVNLNFKLITAVIVSFLIIFKNNLFAKLDSFLSLLLIIFFIFVSAYLLPRMEINNLFIGENNFSLSYGIVLFAFTGYHSLQIIYDLIGKNKKTFIKINLISLMLVFLIYLIYTISLLGIAGKNIKPLSIVYLIDYFNNIYFNYFATIFFVISVLTTFVSLAYYLKRGLNFDFKLKENISWLIISLVIVLISSYNFDNLVKLISLIGSLFVGINLILILLCYLNLKNLIYFKVPHLFARFLIIFFILGWFIGLLSN